MEKNTKKLYPLRINAITVIYVPKEKNNREYAEYYLKRMNGDVEVRYKGVDTTTEKIDRVQLQRMYSAKRTIKQIAAQFSVATTTIQRYIKANNMTR